MESFDKFYKELESELNANQKEALNKNIEQLKETIAKWLKQDPKAKIVCLTSGGT